jgi:hypothetical protein
MFANSLQIKRPVTTQEGLRPIQVKTNEVPQQDRSRWRRHVGEHYGPHRLWTVTSSCQTALEIEQKFAMAISEKKKKAISVTDHESLQGLWPLRIPQCLAECERIQDREMLGIPQCLADRESLKDREMLRIPQCLYGQLTDDMLLALFDPPPSNSNKSSGTHFC